MRVWVDLTNIPHVLVLERLAGLGAVDEALLRDGRLRRLTDPDEVSVERRERHDGLRVRRDPRELVKLLLSAIDS
jgi:hypothetical protein